MGRMLDTLYAAGVTEVFLEVAKEARALLEGEFPREAWTPLLAPHFQYSS